MREQVERTTAPQRIAVTMLIVFGGLALILAVVGLYGVMAATVAQSARQLALRIALGADARHVAPLVLARGLGWRCRAASSAWRCSPNDTADGLLLYQVTQRDPSIFAAAVGVVTLAALTACLAPVRRATRTDPIQVLRA